MKSKMMKLFIMGVALASFCLMGCEPSEDAEGPVSLKVKDADGNVYPTMKLGKQIWMAKNLMVNVEGSVCYGNKLVNCRKYGALYTWEAAKKACPAGWHLPSKAEFESFLEAVKLRLTQIETQKKLNAEPLRKDELSLSKNLGSIEWDGYDTFGFSALPAGDYRSYRNDKFYGLGGRNAFFWTSTEHGRDYAYFFYIFVGDGSAKLSPFGYKNNGSNRYEYDALSVRCIKDSN